MENTDTLLKTVPSPESAAVLTAVRLATCLANAQMNPNPKHATSAAPPITFLGSAPTRSFVNATIVVGQATCCATAPKSANLVLASRADLLITFPAIAPRETHLPLSPSVLPKLSSHSISLRNQSK